MSEQTNIQKLNEEVQPLLAKALEMGVVLVVISVDTKHVPGQMYNPGGVSTYLEKDELIDVLEDTLTNLEASQ